jgi:hypothetical protein
VGHGAVNIEHSETRLVTCDLHPATLALSRGYSCRDHCQDPSI